jgi:hypothetical protein
MDSAELTTLTLKDPARNRLVLLRNEKAQVRCHDVIDVEKVKPQGLWRSRDFARFLLTLSRFAVSRAIQS